MNLPLSKSKYPNLIAALMNKKPGEQGTVKTDQGIVNYKIGEPSQPSLTTPYQPPKKAKAIVGSNRG